MLVEDNLEYRSVLEFALEKEHDIELYAAFGTAEIALRKLAESDASEQPDLILLDLNLPGMNGLVALPQILEYPAVKQVLVLSNSNQEADVVAAISMGAAGYLLKSSTIDSILGGIRSISAGGTLLDSAVAKYIISQIKPKTSPIYENGRDEVLTDREIEVLRLLGDGMVKKEISDSLGISYYTVDSHVRNIYRKMRVRNAAEAITKAYAIRLFSAE
ncbi:LuxR C-terminal-related transcriptional regulator [Rubritalea marina]|uniref:LuxR C-terminal-related transcriptional regulator n=1 Tax=Rubritalea marina TaxID=361055 RepID=UPI000687F003|nr:response regulator transcription factor [Rubritalea marina]